MEDNYKLEKEYTVPYDLFRDAYRDFQKIYVFTKSRIKTLIFIILAIAAVFLRLSIPDSASSKLIYASYLPFVIFIALAFRSWYEPNKARDNLVQSVRTLGEPVYKIGIGDGFIDILTISDDRSVDMETDDEEGEEEAVDDPLPEKTRISITSDFRLHEFEKYFLIVPDLSMLYILPKKDFSESELKTVREITNETVTAAADTFKTEN